MATKGRFVNGKQELYESTTGEVVLRTAPVHFHEECCGTAATNFASPYTGFQSVLPGNTDAVTYANPGYEYGVVEMYAGTDNNDTVFISRLETAVSALSYPSLQVRLAPSLVGGGIAKTAFGIGFCTLAGLVKAGPLKQVASEWTTTGTDVVGIHYDSLATVGNYWSMACNTNVDATADNSGVAPVNNTFNILRVDLRVTGLTIKAHCFIDGTEVASFASAVNPDTEYYPYVACSRRDAVADYGMILVDTMDFWANRPT